MASEVNRLLVTIQHFEMISFFEKTICFLFQIIKSQKKNNLGRLTYFLLQNEIYIQPLPTHCLS
jgi:hypothetical protein